MFTDRLFTGQCQMAGLGIYQFGARFYSPELGRFLSADSMVPQPFNPQSLNRYSYVLNNPIRYTDPSGHDIQCSTDGDCYETCDYNCGGGSGSSSTTTTTQSSGGGGGGGGGDGGGGGGYLASPLAVDITYFDTTINDLYATPPSSGSDGGFTVYGETALLVGAAIFIVTAPVDVALILLPLVPGVGLAAHLLFLPLDILMLNVTLVSIEMMSEGAENPGEEVTIDPLPLVHFFFPDFLN